MPLFECLGDGHEVVATARCDFSMSGLWKKRGHENGLEQAETVLRRGTRGRSHTWIGRKYTYVGTYVYK